MAKKIKQYKGHIIKETTARDEASYPIWIFKDGQLEWECDSVQEAEEWIDSQDKF